MALVNASKSTLGTSEEYIVTLKQDINIDQHLTYVQSHYLSSNSTLQGGSTKSQGVNHKWSFLGFNAYAGSFDHAAINKIKKRKDVAAVEKESTWTVPSLMVQLNAPYYLKQISHRRLERQTEGYVYNSTNAKSRIYVVDTGINAQHKEFSGRVVKGYNAARGTPFTDEIGHGTYVAAIAGGHRYGVMKNSILVDVKSFPNATVGLATVLDGYVWAVKDIKNNWGTHHTVINLSAAPYTAGLFSFALNMAIDIATAYGVSTVVAAGNFNAKPTWTKSAVTVGATDKMRDRWEQSNYGPRVALFAPGVGIQSAWTGPKGTEAAIGSGTSAAAPQVAGVVAYLKALLNLKDSRRTKDLLYRLATQGVVGDAKGSANKFLYNGSGR
ncbi:subtilisin-like protein [Myriangium duriaei CBS 260.36]|uniref:Subtilisin-like protein n=1 Tax=Myriangium duriaei CBS 260.36 TaxID=1168546 RepID=A0A9P4MCD6_9PEZI|nr:subtilisin-like protein [Myriangium duriaei CBS 260.36]